MNLLFQFVYGSNVEIYTEAFESIFNDLKGNNHVEGPDCLRVLREKLQKVIYECNEQNRVANGSKHYIVFI